VKVTNSPDFGFAGENVKGTASVISKVSIVSCVKPSLVPVKVRTYIPGSVVQSGVTIKVDVADPSAGGATDVGRKPASPQESGPDQLSKTKASKPFIEVIVTDVSAYPPLGTVKDEATEIEKSEAGGDETFGPE